MTKQEEIILACTHGVDGRDLVTLGDGRRVVCCCECWNAGVRAGDLERKAPGAEQKARAVEYWRARGVQIGATVYSKGWSIFGVFTVQGTAKAGVNGPYVTCDLQRGQLHPSAWHKEAQP